jgi:hypothetical protein
MLHVETLNLLHVETLNPEQGRHCHPSPSSSLQGLRRNPTVAPLNPRLLPRFCAPFTTHRRERGWRRHTPCAVASLCRLTPVQQVLAEKVFALPAKQLTEESPERKDTGMHDERAHEGAVEERPQASAAEVDAAASKPAALVLCHKALSICGTMLGRQWVR